MVYDEEKVVLLVEDNPDDIDLTLRSFQKEKIANNIVVAKDGVEALDYLYCKGAYVDRPRHNPILVLLDLKLPKINGIQVLKEIRSNESTKMIPVVVLTTSIEECDRIATYSLW